MKYLSVCSGIEAATSAWHHLGWEPVAFSEIEPFPSAVLKHHYPNVPNWGDMTQYKTWPDATIDLLVGGTPCQSFSVAGLRKGLEDPRGNLMLTFLGIADRYRPRYIVWENVPGVLSSNGGRDFGTFLAALGELGYGWAYRVLDAQWFGVAQRRRRVFVVACLGDQRRAAQVLFECESVRRDTAPSRAKGQGAAADAQGSVGGGSWWDGGNTAGTLTKQNANGAQRMPDKDNFGAVLQPHAFKVRGGCEGGGKGYLGSDDTAFTVATHQDQQIAQPVAFRDPCPTLTAKMQGSSGWAPANEDAHLVGITVATHQDQQIYFGFDGDVPKDQTLSETISTREGGITDTAHAVAQPLPFDTTQVTSPANYSSPKPGDPCHPLAAGAHIPAVAFAQNTRNEVRLQNGDGQIAGALSAESGMHQTSYVAFQTSQSGVRIGDVHATLDSNNGSRRHNGVVQAITFGAQMSMPQTDIDMVQTLQAKNPMAVAQPVAFDTYNQTINEHTSQSLSSSASDVNHYGAVMTAMQVRRLTPVECERLQGFPDNHTNIPWRGKAEAPDGPRYKALGNSMAVPVMRWIGERINKQP